MLQITDAANIELVRQLVQAHAYWRSRGLSVELVILNDDLSRVVEAIEISRRTVRIARQSIWTGLGLSGLAMLFAGAGYIGPVIGALLQEVIDVAVILNALRTSRQPH